MSRLRKLLPFALALTLMSLPLVGCGEDDPIHERNCGNVVQRCHWNAATQKFDSDCVYVPADAGTGTCYAGVADAPSDSAAGN